MHSKTATLLLAGCMGVTLSGQTAQALPGPAPENEAIAEYNRVTGRIIVSFTDLEPGVNFGGWSWEIRSASGGLNGDPPLNLPEPMNFAPLVTDTDTLIQVRYSGDPPPIIPYTMVNLDLGTVAAPNLVDVQIWYSVPVSRRQGVVFVVPEPHSLLLLAVGSVVFAWR